MKLSIVIVNYNVRYFLEQCLLSVEKALYGVSGEVFVVDNHSTDDSMPYLKGKFPWVRYIENDENIGFSRANNQALREARGEYVLLLNPDTFIGERTLRECIDFMDKNPQAGMCGVGMLRIDGSFAPESRRGVPTPFVAFCKMSGLGSLFPKSRLFGRYYMQYLNKLSINPIEIVSGAFMFIRKSALDKVGLLDEAFFMYGEDIDLSYRVLKAGYQNYYIPTQILHYKGESTQKDSLKYVNAFHKAMVIFFKKHFTQYSGIYSAFITLTIVMKGAMTYLMHKTRAWSHKKDEMERLKFLIVSDGQNLDDMKNIAEKHQLRYDVFHSRLGDIPSTDVLYRDYDYIVFDTSRYPYSSILEFFRHDESNRRRPFIATYIPSNKSIMTFCGALN
ncbi:MAG: glycosyltransferase family 2 protein [Bacteroidaceae bacterium]|nr:glycosyltransferase family 2 protein [Bacteroidaceae bacterium]